MYMIIRMHLHIRPQSKADPSFVGPEAYIIFGALFNKKKKKKKIQNYVYKIGYESEHPFRVRK
jgi:hypothetical protein